MKNYFAILQPSWPMTASPLRRLRFTSPLFGACNCPWGFHPRTVPGASTPREESTLPVLKRVLDGIRRTRVAQGRSTPRIRLPITIAVLRQIRGVIDRAPDPNNHAFWAVATVAFFGFFRLGELLVGNEAEYTTTTHLSWGRRSNSMASMVKIHLKKSKCDQFGAGADILLGRTGCDVCPVEAIIAYVNQKRQITGALLHR